MAEKSDRAGEIYRAEIEFGSDKPARFRSPLSPVIRV